MFVFFFSSRRRHTRYWRDWSSDVCSSDLLSQPPVGQTVAEEHVRLAPEAHARNVVTATLADFRGLDTLGEITVVALVLLGVATLLWEAPRPAMPSSGGRPPEETSQPAARVVTRAIARLLYLPTLLVAAAILVKGFVETGDGFSAGVVGALGVLLRSEERRVGKE